MDIFHMCVFVCVVKISSDNWLPGKECHRGSDDNYCDVPEGKRSAAREILECVYCREIRRHRCRDNEGEWRRSSECVFVGIFVCLSLFVYMLYGFLRQTT